MRTSTKILLAALVVIAGFAFCSTVAAQPPCFFEKSNTEFLGPGYDMPNIATPGSILFFPYWTGEMGAATLVTVTNTNCSYSKCFDQSNVAWGDVLLHYNYVDGVTWEVFDQFEFLTPNDTLSVLAGEHAFSDSFGFLYVVAMDPVSYQPIDFDWLIGNAIIGGGDDNFLWQAQAIPFQSFSNEVPGPQPACVGPGPVGPSGHLLADGDGDGLADFDAWRDFQVPRPITAPPEYNCFPNELYISHFNEQGGRIKGDLVLFTTLPPVPGPANAVQVDFRFFNNDEFQVSAMIEFDCYAIVPLSDITSFVDNLPPNMNPSGDWDRWDTGWAKMEPRLAGVWPKVGAPVLGAFYQLIDGTGFGAGSLLHMENIVPPDFSRVPVCTEFYNNPFAPGFNGSLPF